MYFIFCNQKEKKLDKYCKLCVKFYFFHSHPIDYDVMYRLAALAVKEKDNRKGRKESKESKESKITAKDAKKAR